MSLQLLALARIVLGSAMIALGYSDWQRAAGTTASGEAPKDLFSQLDEALFPEVPDEVLSRFRKATAFLLMASGLGVCVSVFFTGA